MTARSKIKNRKSKIKVGVIFGGRSAEHQVSLVSAASVINALDKTKYDVIPIGITQEGKWLSSPDAVHLLKSGDQLTSKPESILLPDPKYRGLEEINPQSPQALPAGRQAARQSGNLAQIRESQSIDVIFPVLHGTFGEDGTVQGLFELADIAYVGAGVLGSSVGMDKVVTKQLCEQAGIPVTPYLWFLMKEFERKSRSIIASIEKKFRYPCFVKPANMGSSVGISKAHNRKELRRAIKDAAEYDRKILVERGIENAREIELSVLGNDEPIASVPGEIVSSNEFYDYDAKYVDGKSTEIIPAKLPRGVIRKLQQYAVRTFTAIDCSGMARVDFLVARYSNKIYMNEINTIPGFTSISMYPKLWEASGIAYAELLDRLIELALSRRHEKQQLRTTFKPKTDWFKT